MKLQFTEDERLFILAVKEKLKDSIMDVYLTAKKVASDDAFFVSGGCIGSLLRGEKVNDYDVYFVTEGKARNLLRLYHEDPSYMNQVETYNEKYRDVPGHPQGKLITENATTLKNGIQLITKHYGFPDSIRKTFDFVHCKPYYVPSEDKLYISREQFDLNMFKKLKINNVECFSTEKNRSVKFLERGWRWL